MLGIWDSETFDPFVRIVHNQLMTDKKLKPQQLAFANLVLTKHEHGMSDADCYRNAGYKVRTDGAAKTNAARLLTNANVENYIIKMQKASAEKAGLTLEKVDQAIEEIMSANITDYLMTVEQKIKGGIRYIPILKCHLQDLPREVSAQIQEVKMTQHGLQVKTYSRIDAVRLAAQRLGGLTDKRELSGPGGGPIETANKVIRVSSRKPRKSK